MEPNGRKGGDGGVGVRGAEERRGRGRDYCEFIHSLEHVVRMWRERKRELQLTHAN